MEDFKNYLDKKILTVSHDAGPANTLSSFIKFNRIKSKYYLSGPAIKIFKKNFFRGSLRKIIKESDVILTGTGWDSDLEYNAIKYSRKYNKYCIVFFDDWSNYKKRFTKNKITYLPSKIYVFDDYSYSLAKKYFQGKLKIKKIDNYYLKYFKKNKSNFIKKNAILYLSSNFDDFLKKKIDYKMFLKFLKKINLINKKLGVKIKIVDIKLHPAENVRKYLSIKKINTPNINIIPKNISMRRLLSEYKFAGGTNTMSLVLSKISGLRTFNNIKQTGFRSKIPKTYIDYII
jgi:hypothetical protein